MSYEEELEALQAEAMDELEGETNDTDTDDNQHEESTDTSDNEGEIEDDGEDSERNEDEDDYEDGEELDDQEDEDDEIDDDDTSDNSDSDSSEDSNDFEPVEVTIGGQTITLNSQEELLQFVQKKDTGKTKSRKSDIDQVVEQGKLSQDDLALLIDAKNGNKAAIAKLAKDSGIDIYDIDDDAAAGYKQQFQAQLATEVDNVASDIMEDTQLHETFKQVVSTVPQDFAGVLSTDANALKHFAGHVKSGLAQKIIPEAMKQQMLQGGTFLENYAKIGREMSESKEAPEKSKTKRKENPRAEKLRKRASNQKGKNKGTKTKVTGDDVWNLSDEDFKKQYM